jgi:hypothetical protein
MLCWYICPGNLTRIPDEINLGGKNCALLLPSNARMSRINFCHFEFCHSGFGPPSRFGPLGLNLLSAGSRPAPNLWTGILWVRDWISLRSGWTGIRSQQKGKSPGNEVDQVVSYSRSFRTCLCCTQTLKPSGKPNPRKGGTACSL